MRTGTRLRDVGDGFARLNLDNFVLTDVMAAVAAVRGPALVRRHSTAGCSRAFWCARCRTNYFAALMQPL
jgi:hypothetical protein